MILGLAVGLVAATQMARSQGAIASLTDNNVVVAPQVNDIQVVSTPIAQTASVDFVAADVTVDDSSSFASLQSVRNQSDSATTLDLSEWTPSQSAAQSDTQMGGVSSPLISEILVNHHAKQDGTINASFYANDKGDWTSVDSSVGMPGFLANSYQGNVSSTPAESKDIAAPAIGATAATTEAPAGSLLSPQIVTPEPNTIVLLVMGGAGFASSALRRKKSA